MTAGGSRQCRLKRPVPRLKRRGSRPNLTKAVPCPVRCAHGLPHCFVRSGTRVPNDPDLTQKTRSFAPVSGVDRGRFVGGQCSSTDIRTVDQLTRAACTGPRCSGLHSPAHKQMSASPQRDRFIVRSQQHGQEKEERCRTPIQKDTIGCNKCAFTQDP